MRKVFFSLWGNKDIFYLLLFPFTKLILKANIIKFIADKIVILADLLILVSSKERNRYPKKYIQKTVHSVSIYNNMNS